MSTVKKNKQAIIWRIDGIQTPPPPLTMLINPSNIDLTYTPLVNESRTLGGFCQEFWGEQLTSLSASGKTAMFYNSQGITNADSKTSTSFRSLMRLVNIYKSNGKDYASEIPAGNLALKSNPNKITALGFVMMTYLDKQYQGFFESFTVKESADMPYQMEYDLSFKVTRTVGDLIIQNGSFVKEST